MNDVQKIVEALKRIVSLMVDKPAEVRVETRVTDTGSVVRIVVAPSDTGKIIGQGGRTAQALRQILQAINMTQNAKIYLIDRRHPC
jgi:predicted RNA-binding protein YlqC (UPF0109 family)